MNKQTPMSETISTKNEIPNIKEIVKLADNHAKKLDDIHGPKWWNPSAHTDFNINNIVITEPNSPLIDEQKQRLKLDKLRDKSEAANLRKIIRDDEKAIEEEDDNNYKLEVKAERKRIAQERYIKDNEFDIINTDVATEFKNLRTLGENGVFKLAARTFFLTYSNCDEKKSLIEANVKDKLSHGAKGKKFILPFFLICKELHMSGIPHFHVLATLDVARQITSHTVFDIVINNKTYHPNIASCSSNMDLLRVKGYVTKFDKKHKAEHKYTDMMQAIFGCTTLQEALIMIGSRMSTNDIKNIFESKREDIDIDREIKPLPEYKWYDKIFKIINSKIPDFRSIHWFCDLVGNTGKSMIAANLYLSDRAHYVSAIGSVADFNNNISNAIKSGWSQDLLIIDMPRTVKENLSIYTVTESLKNGIISCTKYDSKTVKLKEGVKIIILANWWPKLDTMSMDRWKLYRILGTDTCHKVSSAEVMRLESIQEYETLFAQTKAIEKKRRMIEEINHKVNCELNEEYMTAIGKPCNNFGVAFGVNNNFNDQMQSKWGNNNNYGTVSGFTSGINN